MQGDVGGGNANEAIIEKNRHGEGNDVLLGAIQVDKRPVYGGLASLLRTGVPRHVQVIVETIAAAIEIQLQRLDLFVLGPAPPLQVHLAIFQLTRGENHASAMKLETLGVKDLPDATQQWLEVALIGAPGLAPLPFPNARYLGAQVVETLEDVTNGSVDQRCALG
nr:hypothetical protein GCM10020185_84740 [Pseudomonas brassicacearum subsp. brassicacearum]